MLARAHERGIRAAFVAGDEVYSGRQLRRAIRSRGMGYVLAVRANHTLTASPGRALTAARAARLIPRAAWHRIRTGHGSKGVRHYDLAMLEVTGDDTPPTAAMMTGTACCWSVGTATPEPCRSTGAGHPSRCHWPG